MLLRDFIEILKRYCKGLGWIITSIVVLVWTFLVSHIKVLQVLEGKNLYCYILSLIFMVIGIMRFVGNIKEHTGLVSRVFFSFYDELLYYNRGYLKGKTITIAGKKTRFLGYSDWRDNFTKRNNLINLNKRDLVDLKKLLNSIEKEAHFNNQMSIALSIPLEIGVLTIMADYLRDTQMFKDFSESAYGDLAQLIVLCMYVIFVISVMVIVVKKYSTDGVLREEFAKTVNDVIKELEDKAKD